MGMMPTVSPEARHRGRVPDPGFAPVNRPGRALGSAAKWPAAFLWKSLDHRKRSSDAEQDSAGSDECSINL